MAQRPDTHKNNFNLIRLLAAFQVLVVHIYNSFEFEFEAIWFDILRMFPGVPIFFFISGYLIFQSYDRTRDMGLGSYARRRILRIFPALWLVTIFATILVLLTGYLPPAHLLSGQFWLWFASQVTVVQFYNPDFLRGFGVGSINGALWTLSVELQFYVLMPVLAFLARRHGWVLLIVLVLSLAINVAVHTVADLNAMSIKLTRVSFLPWISMFIFGMMVAQWAGLRRMIMRANVLIVVPAFVLSMLFIGDPRMNATNGINPIAATLLMILVFRVSQSKWIYALPGQELVRRHDISYGIYVMHMPIINTLLYLSVLPIIVNGLLALVLTVFAAVLSWFFVERPALRLK